MDNVLLVDVDSEETSVPVPQQPAHLPSPPTSPMRERLKELPRLDSSCSTAEADAGYDYAANNTPAIARRAELRRSRVREKPSTDVELDAESKGESLNDRSHAGARQSDSSSLAEDAQIGPDQIEFDGKPRRSSNKKLFKRWIEKAAEAASQKIPCYPESVFKNVVFSHPDRSRVDEDEKDDLEKPLTHFLINSKEAIYDLRIFKKTAKKFLLKSPKHAPLSEVDSLQAKVASVELALDAFRRLFQWVVINNVWMLEFNCKDIPEWHSVSEDAEYLQGYVLHWADVSGDGIEKVKGIPLHLLWVVQLLVPEQMVELLQSCNCDSEEWRFTGQSDGSKTSKTACPISLNETLLHYFKRTSDATASQCIRKQVDVQRLLLFSSSLRGTISRVLNIRFSPPPQDHENSIEESDSRPVSTLVAPDNHFGQAQSPATSPQLSSLNDQVANLPSRPATGGATQGQTSDNAGAGYSSDAKDPTQAHSPTPAYLFPRKHILDLILQLKTFHSIEEIQPSGINHDMYTCNNIVRLPDDADKVLKSLIGLCSEDTLRNLILTRTPDGLLTRVIDLLPSENSVMPKSRPQAYRKPSSAGVITISPATIPRVRKVIYWLIKDRPQLVVDACRASAEESNVRNPYHLLLDSNDYLSTREHGTQSTLDPAKIAIAAPKGSTIQRPKPTADDSDDVADYMRKCLLYPDNTLMPEEKKKFLYRKATDVKRTNLDFLSAGYRNVSKNIPDFFLGLDRIVLNLEYESVLEYVALPKPIHSPSDPSTDPTKSGVDVYPHLFNEWLREQKGVKKIFEVFVDDSLDTPHTDKSILESLSNFDVEIWKWMKLDICPSIIAKAAPNVRKVYLACNTKKSVLQGWTCKDGLLSLKRLEFLHITLYRPKYEPEDYWRTCLADFENKLLRRFQQQIDDKRRAKLPNIQMRIEDYTVLSPDLVTKSETARAVDNACGQFGHFHKALKPLIDALKNPPIFTDPKQTKKSFLELPNIKIALIDDGINHSLAKCKIIAGATFYEPIPEDERSNVKPTELYQAERGLEDFYSLETNLHGTLMAYCIQEMCPMVSLCFGRLDSRPSAAGKGAFTVASAIEALKWAHEMDVDIISMSWSFSEKDCKENSNQFQTFKRALNIQANEEPFESDKNASPGVNNISSQRPRLFFAASHNDPDKKRAEELKDFEFLPASHQVQTFEIATIEQNQEMKEKKGTILNHVFPFPGNKIPITLQEGVTTTDNCGNSFSTAIAAGCAALILYTIEIVLRFDEFCVQVAKNPEQYKDQKALLEAKMKLEGCGDLGRMENRVQVGKSRLKKAKTFQGMMSILKKFYPAPEDRTDPARVGTLFAGPEENNGEFKTMDHIRKVVDRFFS